MLNSLIEKHAAALKTWVNTVGPGEDLEAEGEAYDAFVGAEYAFVVHQCADPAEVQQKLSYVAQCPTLADAIQIDLHSEFMTSIRLAPAPGGSSKLAQAVESWRRAEDQYRNAVTLDPANDRDALWHAKNDAESVLIEKPCRTLADIRQKIEIALDSDSVFEGLASATYSADTEERVLRVFLRSILEAAR
ncbi:hypothetical protein [Rhizobium beringeri]|uniref:hypothetical protein n=1 Tax=Rhizobium beringeri TaxID=3019934 RepID=UPI003B5AA9BD